MKKALALLLAICMLLALAACSGSSAPAAAPETASEENAVETGDAASEIKYLTQTITLDVFGTPVDIEFTQDAAGTQYTFSYFFAGNDIDATGEIVDGVYTLTDDPSGFASEIELEIYEALSSEWTADNGETVTQAPFAAPDKSGDDANKKYQTVTANLFGDDIDVNMIVNQNETGFTMEYIALGDLITAYGEIKDGEYIITEDPTGFASMMIENVVPLLTDEWIDGMPEPMEGGASSAEPSGEPSAELPEGDYTKYQEIPIEIFGEAVVVTLEVNEEETEFKYSYFFANNDLAAAGIIENGELSITADPSGLAANILPDVQTNMTEDWIAY